MIDKALIEILACPACKADVELIDNKIVCKNVEKYPSSGNSGNADR